MMQSVRLSIPSPCAEDWDKMTPVERGRHCESCRKTVVDFTLMTDDEIFRFFKEAAKASGAGTAHPGICGRLMSGQLGRHLTPTPVQRNGWSGWKWLVAGSLVLSKAPEGGRPALPLRSENYSRPEVIKDTKMPIHAVPDSDVIVGGVVAPPVVRDTLVEMQCQQILMGDTTIRAMTGDVEVRTDTNADIKPDTAELPEVVVRGYPATKDRSFTGAIAVIRAEDSDSIGTDTSALIKRAAGAALNILKDTASALVPALRAEDPVCLYPNPVVRGGQVSFAWNGGAGRRQVMLIATGGQIVGRRQFNVAGKGQVDEWVLPHGLAAGLYYVRTVQTDGKVQTTELLVQ